MRSLLAAALTVGLMPYAAADTPATPTVTNVFNLRVNNSANSGNRATGDIMVWGANGVLPPAGEPGAFVYGTSGICPVGKTCDSFATDPDWIKQRLFERDMTNLPHQYYASRPYDPALTGSWRLYLSTSSTYSTNTMLQTPSLDNVGPMPFVSSMSVSGSGLTPTVNWTLPSSSPETVDQMRVRVFDNSHPVTVASRNGAPSSFLQADQIFQSAALPSTSYSVPAGLLSYGTHYSISVDLNHLRPDGSPVSRSSSYFDFTPIDPASLPAGVGNIALPSLTPVATTAGLLGGPVYNFHVDQVSPNSVTFIDPVVATGFTYRTGAGDPNFRTVQVATNVGDGLYEVWAWNGSNWLQIASGLAAGTTFDFTSHGYALGVDRFEIRGIESSANVNAFDLTAFVTGLSFMADGSFTGSMQAITAEAVPEPATWALWLAGIAVLVERGRRSRSWLGRRSPARAGSTIALAILGMLGLSGIASAAQVNLYSTICGKPLNANWSDAGLHGLGNSCASDVKLGNGQTIHGGASVAMSAQASGGVLKMQTSVSTAGFARANSNGTIQSGDTLTFAVPGYVGAIDVTFAMLVDAHIDVTTVWEGGPNMAASAGWRLNTGLNQQLALSLDARASASVNYFGATHESSASVNGKPGNPVGLQVATLHVPANAPLPLQMRLDIDANGGTGDSYGSTFASADLGHSIYWGGILSVKDASGAPLTYSVSSASGVDYRISYAPVPEPTSGALWLAGLTGIAAWRRRRN